MYYFVDLFERLRTLLYFYTKAPIHIIKSKSDPRYTCALLKVRGRLDRIPTICRSHNRNKYPIIRRKKNNNTSRGKY